MEKKRTYGPWTKKEVEIEMGDRSLDRNLKSKEVFIM